MLPGFFMAAYIKIVLRFREDADRAHMVCRRRDSFSAVLFMCVIKGEKKLRTVEKDQSRL